MAADKTIDSWLAALDPSLRSVAEALRRLILESDPDLSESIKWGNPVYEKHGKVCYLASSKAYVSLGFFNGAALTDPEGFPKGLPKGFIEGTGKKMRHVKVRSCEDIQNELFSSWVREAVVLNKPG